MPARSDWTIPAWLKFGTGALFALSERRQMEQVVAEENADRRAVYREIAVANGHPEWEERIRETFADRWIANARPGWYYQDESGNWQRK